MWPRGEPWFCQPVAPCPWHTQGLRDTSGLREGDHSLARVPRQELQQQQISGETDSESQDENGKASSALGCPGGAGSWSGTAEHAVQAAMEGLSWLPGGLGRQQEGGTASEEGLLALWQNALRSLWDKSCFFFFKQQVSEVLPELCYSAACQEWQSLQDFCVPLPGRPSIRLWPSAASPCGAGQAAPSTCPTAAGRQIVFDWNFVSPKIVLQVFNAFLH